jgi:ADP-ribose pyrophosphatase
MKPWKRIEPTISTKIDYHNVIIKTFELPDSTIATRATFLAEDRQAAGVIAVTKDNMVIVARQYRPGPEKFMNEIPGGYVDVNEAPETAARRELLEETGYEAGSIFSLGAFDRDAYMNGTWHYFLAIDCEPASSQTLDHDEFVSVELLSIQAFVDNAKKGLMTDPYAVLAAYDKLMEIQEKEIA